MTCVLNEMIEQHVYLTFDRVIKKEKLLRPLFFPDDVYVMLDAQKKFFPLVSCSGSKKI